MERRCISYTKKRTCRGTGTPCYLNTRVNSASPSSIRLSTILRSIALGAAIIEKHFTLDRDGGGPEDSFSLEPADLAALCRDCKTAWAALGKVDYGRKSSEQGNVKFRSHRMRRNILKEVQ